MKVIGMKPGRNWEYASYMTEADKQAAQRFKETCSKNNKIDRRTQEQLNKIEERKENKKGRAEFNKMLIAHKEWEECRRAACHYYEEFDRPDTPYRCNSDLSIEIFDRIKILYFCKSLKNRITFINEERITQDFLYRLEEAINRRDKSINNLELQNRALDVLFFNEKTAAANISEITEERLEKVIYNSYRNRYEKQFQTKKGSYSEFGKRIRIKSRFNVVSLDAPVGDWVADGIREGVDDEPADFHDIIADKDIHTKLDFIKAHYYLRFCAMMDKYIIIKAPNVTIWKELFWPIPFIYKTTRWGFYEWTMGSAKKNEARLNKFNLNEYICPVCGTESRSLSFCRECKKKNNGNKKIRTLPDNRKNQTRYIKFYEKTVFGLPIKTSYPGLLQKIEDKKKRENQYAKREQFLRKNQTSNEINFPPRRIKSVAGY